MLLCKLPDRPTGSPFFPPMKDSKAASECRSPALYWFQLPRGEAYSGQLSCLVAQLLPFFSTGCWPSTKPSEPAACGLDSAGANWCGPSR